MKTEEYILLKNTNIDLEKVELPILSKHEVSKIEELIEFTRHFQEIDQLYHIFKVNLKNILHYRLNIDDTIVRLINNDSQEDDVIIINALVINYISSAKSFVESIECFIKDKLNQGTLDEFKNNCSSKIYDERFSYRLLIRLRDYAQHGHLPVYMSYDKKCSFDLDQILYTPHFSHNKKLKEEIISIREKILEQYQDNPRIMFTRTIAEFNICIIEIYIYFIDTIIEKMKQIVDDFRLLIKERPEIIYTSKDELNGFILYDMKDGSIQGMNPKEEPLEMINKIKLTIERELIKEKEEFNKCF